MHPRPFWHIAAAAILLMLYYRNGAAVLAAALLIALHFIFRAFRDRPWLSRILGNTPTDNETANEESIFWLLSGFAVMAVAIGMLECRQPYYFTQDDNQNGLLPVLVDGCRSLFSGVFPNYNPHQFMGWSPISEGVFTLTYPPAYLAYGFSRFILGDESLTLECLAVFNLLFGFGAVYWAARQWGARPSFAAIAGLSYMLAGVTLITGRCWLTYMNVLPYFPLFFGLAGRMYSGPVGWRWAITTAAAIGLAFHASFVQLWAYGLLYLAGVIAVLVLLGSAPWRRALWFIPACILGIALASPLLYVQWAYASGVSRHHLAKGVNLSDLWAFLLPYPLASARHPQGYGLDQIEHMGQFFYSGTLLFAVTAIAACSACGVRWNRRIFLANVWTLGAVFALLTSMGDKGLIWRAMSYAPLLNYFQNAERFLALFNISVALAGALLLSRWVGAFRNRRWIECGCFVLAAALLLYHCSIATCTFSFIGGKPYPTMPAYMAEQLAQPDPLRPKRVATLTPWDMVPAFRSGEPDFPLGLDNNFASAYGLYAFHGYDPLVWSHHFYADTVRRMAVHHGGTSGAERFAEAVRIEAQTRDEIYKAYGVRWAVIYAPLAQYFLDAYPELAKEPANQPVYIRTIEGSAPLAFYDGHPEQGYPIRLDGSGAHVELPSNSQGGPFIINVLAWPNFRVYADGHSVPFCPDEWGRMRLELPPEVKEVHALYRPPWGRGFALMAVLLALGACWMYRQHHSETRNASTP